MRKIFILLMILFSGNQISFSNNFEIFPIIYNLQSVKTIENKIFAYGNTVYAMISEDEGQNWYQKKLLNSGIIVSIIKENNNLTAFGISGEVCVSDIFGNNPVTKKKFDDSILAVVEYPDGYFVRARNRIFTINKNFEIINEFSLYSPVLDYISTVDLPNYLKSIAYFKNHFIVEIDSSYFIRFDTGLKAIDTLSVLKSGLINASKSGYWIEKDENYLYFRVVEVNKSVLKAYIFRTVDFDSIEKMRDLRYSFSIFHIYDNHFYALNTNEPYLKDSTRLTPSDRSDYIKDFTILNNKKIIVGNFKLIKIFDLKDSTLSVISDVYGYSSSKTPMILPNNEILLFSGGFGGYYPYFWKSTDNGITFKPTVNKKDPKYDPLFYLYDLRIKYYDTLNRKIYFGGLQDISGPSILIETNDDCESFKSNLTDIFFAPSNASFINALSAPEIHVQKDYFIISSGSYSFQGSKISNVIYRLDKEFKIQNYFIDSSGMSIDYIYSLDTNTFIVHDANTTDSTSEIKYTTNQGQSWELIYKYPKYAQLSYFREIWNKGRKLLALIHSDTRYRPDYVGCFLDVVDLENFSFRRIKEWYPDSQTKEDEFGLYSAGIESDDKYVYISFQDTLFYVKDIFDESSWVYHTLPTKGGKIVTPLVKYGDEIIARYKDESLPWSNMLFKIKPLDLIPSSVENNIEFQNYLYAYPPYPMPAINEVRSLIYWDTSIDIENDEMFVYDMYGTKVAGKEKLRIDKLTAYSGNLVWDCSGVPTGIYLINIKHGTQNRTIKAIVTK